MKKLITVVLLLVFTMTLSGCKNDLEKAFIRMNEVESYRVNMTLHDVPYFGTLSSVIQVDGDMKFTGDFVGPNGTYSKMIDGEEYEYIPQPDGTYELSNNPVETDEEMEANLLDALNSNNFEQSEDGTWEMIEERVYLDDEQTTYIEDVSITLNDDGYIDQMTLYMSDEESSRVLIEIEYTGFNTTTVELP